MRTFPDSKRSRNSTKAFSSVEVIVCILILAFAVVPLVTSISGGRKKATLTEYHALAQMRANFVLETLQAKGFVKLAEEAGASGGTLTAPIPLSDERLSEAYRRRVSPLEEEITFEEIRDGLAVVRVVIRWKLEDKLRKHRFETAVVVADRTHSIKSVYPLEQKGGG